MDEIRIDVHVRGIRPLLQNKFSEESENNLPSKKGKKYDDKVEAEKRLEKNEDQVICQPASHFEASMIKSAAEFKFQGNKTYKSLFIAGVFVSPNMIPHKNKKYKIDKRAVTVNRSKIWRCRPRFEKWELSFQLVILDDRIQVPIAEEILKNAGKFHGIGDYRPRFGLFEVVKFDVFKKK